MLRGQIPPQAYAKEVLVQAFEWLQGQPESVRNQANSADALVSLYNRARRSGHSGDAPVSAEKFKSELKGIAAQFKDFTDPEPERPVTRQLPLEFSRNQQARPSMIEEPREAQIHREPPPREAPAPRYQESAGLDARTLEILHKVKGHLNLSSDTEALRMLVVLGFERLQNLFR